MEHKGERGAGSMYQHFRKSRQVFILVNFYLVFVCLPMSPPLWRVAYRRHTHFSHPAPSNSKAFWSGRPNNLLGNGGGFVRLNNLCMSLCLVI